MKFILDIITFIGSLIFLLICFILFIIFCVIATIIGIIVIVPIFIYETVKFAFKVVKQQILLAKLRHKIRSVSRGSDE